MRAKNDGVDLDALRPELARLAPLIDVCYAAFEALAIVTATTGGVHMRGSLHGRGLAIDLRIKHLGGVPRQRSLHACLKRNIDSLYPGMYDTLLEDPGGAHAHIHCEASPTLVARIGVGDIPA